MPLRPLPVPDPAQAPRRAAAPAAPWRLALSLPLLCGAAALHAQTGPAPAPDSDSAPPACDAPALLAQPADTLHQHLQRCEGNAAYLLHLGQLRNQQGQYEQAADHLERALMLVPDQPQALLQYAIALAGSSDSLSALQLMTDLQQRSDLPAPLRAQLRSVVATWAPRVQAPIWAQASSGNGAVQPSLTSLSGGMRLGYDSNLQGSSRLSSLTLTLPGENITLPVEPSQLPRSGSVLQADLRATHQRLLPGGARWGTQAALQQRTTPSLHSAGSTQAEWQLDYTAAPIQQASDAIKTEANSQQPGGWAPWGSASIAALRSRSGTRYASHNLSVGLEHAAQGCAARWGLDAQNRDLRSNPILSGHYLGASLQWHCAPNTGNPGALQWLAVLRLGQDRASNPGRPGGHQNQAGLRLQASAPAPNLWQPVAGAGPAGQGSGARWVLDADYSHARDQHGYSPLLDNNRVRRIHRLTARIEWQQPLLPGVQAVVGAEAVAQNASLALFQMRSHGLWLGLRGQW